MGTSRGRSTTILIAAALLVLLTVLAARAADASLRNLFYVSGWILLAALLPLLCYRPVARRPARPTHLALGACVAALYLVHTDGRWPLGVFERALAAFFVVVAASGVLGGILARRAGGEGATGSYAQWLAVHVPLSWALAVLAFAHGVLAHCHSVLGPIVREWGS